VDPTVGGGDQAGGDRGPAAQGDLLQLPGGAYHGVSQKGSSQGMKDHLKVGRIISR